MSIDRPANPGPLAISESARRLASHRRAWRRKPALREIYGRYHRLLEKRAQRPILEIGAGAGHFREGLHGDDRIVSLDVLPGASVDLRADARALPFRSGVFGAVVMFDVLHHLDRPVEFLAEAARVLRTGGTIGMIEPGISPLSGLVYRLFHPEPVDLEVDPWSEPAARPSRDPFDGNQAIPTRMFSAAGSEERLCRAVPELRLRRSRWIALWAYPASGGFRSWGLLPLFLVGPLLRLERRLLPRIGHLAAFRLHVELEKVGGSRP